MDTLQEVQTTNIHERSELEREFPSDSESIWEFIQDIFGEKPDRTQPNYKELLEDWRYLRRTYGLKLSLRKINQSDQEHLAAERMTFSDAVEAVHILREEISKYPPSYIAKLQITRVRILEALSKIEDEEDEAVGGLAYEDGDIYIANGWDNEYYRRTIHHEISHRADYEEFEAKDKIPFIGWLLDEWKDERFNADWSSLNNGGSSVYMHGKWKEWQRDHPGSRPVGFARAYGLKNEGEDRATVTEYLMTATNGLFIKCKSDGVLEAKTQRIISLFDRRTGGLMNEQYFTDLAQGKVNTDYWK